MINGIGLFAGIRTPYIVTTHYSHIRISKDRTIQEKDFDKIQKYRVYEMKKWARFLKKAKEEHREINLAAANNQYVGFGPVTANTFRKVMDLSEVTWSNIQVPQPGETVSGNTNQTSIRRFETISLII